MRRAILLGALIAIGGLSLVVSGQAPGPSDKSIAATKIEKVKENLYIITGSGAEDTAAFSGGNEFFGASIESIVQENTKANMAKMDEFKDAKAQFLPKKTYKDTMKIGSGKDEIDLYYFGRGHTNGDTFVVFPALRT